MQSPLGPKPATFNAAAAISDEESVVEGFNSSPEASRVYCARSRSREEESGRAEGSFSMSSETSPKRGLDCCSLDLKSTQFNFSWEDVICPICLDIPHNGVLLKCSSYIEGCRPFICDTGVKLSDCLNRFKTANGLPANAKASFAITDTSAGSDRVIQLNAENRAVCPLCRGEVTGWMVIDDARTCLNKAKRCCAENQCSYIGSYTELQEHAEQEHPHSRPSEVDPALQKDWENFERSSEMLDVLSTVHSEVPNGLVLGDYVIEYGDESGDEFGDEGHWWSSCILYHVFNNFRPSRNRRRSRANGTGRSIRRSHHEVSDVDEGPTSFSDIADYHFDTSDEELAGIHDDASVSRGSDARRSYRRRRFRFRD